MKKNIMAAKYILLALKFSFIKKRWTFISAGILQKSQK